jgi:predicted NUDIX family NTP pyrophosphohydrolase
MPHTSGLYVIARLRVKRKGLYAILVTGHPDKSIRERGAAVGVPVVEKPVRASALTNCIQQVLAVNRE